MLRLQKTLLSHWYANQLSKSRSTQILSSTSRVYRLYPPWSRTFCHQCRPPRALTLLALALTNDPVFVVLFLGWTLADQPSSSSFAWLALFRTNVISLCIRVLSSKDGRMLELASCQLAALWKQIGVSGTSSYFKTLILYLFDKSRYKRSLTCVYS